MNFLLSAATWEDAQKIRDERLEFHWIASEWTDSGHPAQTATTLNLSQCENGGVTNRWVFEDYGRYLSHGGGVHFGMLSYSWKGEPSNSLETNNGKKVVFARTLPDSTEPGSSAPSAGCTVDL